MRKVKSSLLPNLILILILSCLTNAQWIYFDDGENHYVDHTEYRYEEIILDNVTDNDPGTRLEVATGGWIYGVSAYNNSTVDANGGIVEVLNSFNNSTVNVKNNSIFMFIHTRGNSTITINSGSVYQQLVAFDDSIVTINGDEFYHPDFMTEFDARGNATIYLYGSNFSAGGVTLDSGDNLRNFGTIGGDYISSLITGTLLDGSSLNNVFRLTEQASIIIIPEPCTLFLLVLGGLLIGKGYKTNFLEKFKTTWKF